METNRNGFEILDDLCVSLRSKNKHRNHLTYRKIMTIGGWALHGDIFLHISIVQLHKILYDPYLILLSLASSPDQHPYTHT